MKKNSGINRAGLFKSKKKLYVSKDKERLMFVENNQSKTDGFFSI